MKLFGDFLSRRNGVFYEEIIKFITSTQKMEDLEYAVGKR